MSSESKVRDVGYIVRFGVDLVRVCLWGPDCKVVYVYRFVMPYMLMVLGLHRCTCRAFMGGYALGSVTREEPLWGK